MSDLETGEGDADGSGAWRFWNGSEKKTDGASHSLLAGFLPGRQENTRKLLMTPFHMTMDSSSGVERKSFFYLICVYQERTPSRQRGRSTPKEIHIKVWERAHQLCSRIPNK